jgi:uncharacterized protein YeaO (DUF488 family)
MLYTSYFAKIKKLPKNIVTISICGKAPDSYKGVQYKKLAPKYDFFMKYKQDHDEGYYLEHFWNEVLNPLSVREIVDQLYNLSGGKDIVMLCYEKPDEFCHRHIVSEWLNKNGFYCEEYCF